MNNKQLQFVSFEQAKRLKKAGFDWSVNHVGKYYDQIGDLKNGYIQAISAEYQPYPAPTVALALKWFRDEKGCTIGIGDAHSIFNGKEEVYRACFNRKGMEGRLFVKESEGDIGFKTYELAESALLDELLTLIDKEK